MSTNLGYKLAVDAPECVDAVECLLSFQCSRAAIQDELRSIYFVNIQQTVWNSEYDKSIAKLGADDVLGPKIAKIVNGPSRHFIRSYALSGADSIMSVKTGGDGKHATISQVHQSVLCSSSKFFKTKSKPEWSKSTATVDLSHIDTETFVLYVSWLYSSNFVLGRVEEGNSNSAITKSTWKLLAAAYNLGDELMDTNFRNSIADIMAVECTKQPLTFDAEAPVILYNGTPQFASSKICLLLADIIDSHGYPVFLRTVPQELEYDMFKALDRGGSHKPPKQNLEADPCFYHDHMGNEEECFFKGTNGWKIYYQE